jgi:hypothetical protein
VSSQDQDPAESSAGQSAAKIRPPQEMRSPQGPLLYWAAAAGAAASVFFLRSGFLGLLFLLPLGLCAFLGNEKTAWFGALLAVLGNVSVSVSVYLRQGSGPVLLQWNALYYGAMVIIFTWINAPPRRFQKFLPLRSEYRLALGAAAGSVVMIPFFLLVVENGDLRDYFNAQISGLNASSQFLNADELLDYMAYIGLRGGILISCLVFLVISRQLAVILMWFVRRVRPAGGLINFHAGPFFIWILSFALGIVLLGRMVHIEPAEIAGWNLLALCGTLYLAQGIGITLYFLMKLPPLLRIAMNIGVVILFFNPGINVLLLGILILLGIAENWLPMRVAKH